MMFASYTVDFRLSLDFFDSGLYTCTSVARLTLALAKLSCNTLEVRARTENMYLLFVCYSGADHGGWGE